MYNNVGVTTPRGSGSSGYTQKNFASLPTSQNKSVSTKEAVARSEAEVNRKPNPELLDHENKRKLEMKCLEMQDLMEEKGHSEVEIRQKVDEYRNLLCKEFESGNWEDASEQPNLRNSHTRAKVAKENRDRMRDALGIDK
ncbi:cwf21 domain-containing protein [Ditylenchus destructor]|nr:cwf21 domain-containing protein [Ditylenchus destructor]